MAERRERRSFTRVPFEGRAWLTDGAGRRHRARVLDLCLQGMLVALPPGWAPKPGERLAVALELLPGEPPLGLEAAVAHREPDPRGGSRVGLRCLHLELEALSRLRRLLELNLGDGAAVERELGALSGEGPEQKGPEGKGPAG